MLVIEEDRLALQQGIYDDCLADILPVVKAKCTGVARIIVVKRKLTPSETEFTWIFKGTNNEIQVRHTFTIEGLQK
jgi:hypothetical protein